MLDPWIIEEIRRREQEERDRRDEQHRPAIETPYDAPSYAPQQEGLPPKEEGERGVVIVDFRIF
jgi:hypothetical protein